MGMGCDAQEDAGSLSLKYGPNLGLGALNYKRVTPPQHLPPPQWQQGGERQTSEKPY